jgi:hypothetical protein
VEGEVESSERAQLDSSSDAAGFGEQQTAEQQAAGDPEELCKVGSWSSGSGDASSPDAAAADTAAEAKAFASHQLSDSAIGSEASEGDKADSDEDVSNTAVVAPEDVVILAEPSAVQTATIQVAATPSSGGGELATNSLYDLD